MTTAYLYVQDTLADWEFGYLTGELNTGRFFAEPGTRLPVRTVGATREPVRTMGGVLISPELTVGEIDPAGAALLLLAGGDTWLEPVNRPILERAGVFLAAGVPVAAICGATVGLASVGLLDDRPHTSIDLDLLRHLVPGYRGSAHYRTEPAVTGGDLITASGVAALEFARAVLTRLGVLSPAALDAWYRLNTTHRPECYYELMAALPQPVG